MAALVFSFSEYPILLRQSSQMVSLLVLIPFLGLMSTKCKPQQQRVKQLLSTPMLSLLSTLWLQGVVVVVVVFQMAVAAVAAVLVVI
jgi:polyferredoxin